MQVTIRTDIRPLLRAFDQLRRDQIPFATSVALNKTANDARAALAEAMTTGFVNPTPWALKAVRVKYSTKRDLRALVSIDDASVRGGNPAAVLGHHVLTGARPLKAFERVLQSRGLMPAGLYAVPTTAAPKDTHGNPPRAFLSGILAVLQGAGGASTSTRAARARRRLRRSGIEYFAGRPSPGAPLGIWERRKTGFGQAVRPVFLYVSSTRYGKRLAFWDVVARTVERRFPQHFAEAWQQAIRSAR